MARAAYTHPEETPAYRAGYSAAASDIMRLFARRCFAVTWRRGWSSQMDAFTSDVDALLAARWNRLDSGRGDAR